MRFVVLLCLLLSACSSSHPRREYRQGAFPMPVEAPPFEPSTDSPITTGQPGYVGPVENVPRSPRGRILPQTPQTRREPGIWASDSGRSDSPLEIAGIRLPVPTEAVLDALERYAPFLCHALITGPDFGPTSALRGDAFTPEQRACMVAKWYRDCVS